MIVELYVAGAWHNSSDARLLTEQGYFVEKIRTVPSPLNNVITMCDHVFDTYDEDNFEVCSKCGVTKVVL